MKKFSIIMPFLSEGIWPVKTVQSIYDTADNNLFEIIAINENPSDHYDFSKFTDVKYIENKQRMGVDGCRQMGVELSQTPYCLIIDAHELFYPNTNWLNKIIDCVEEGSNIIWCFTCVGIGYGVEDLSMPNKGKYYGADLKLYTEKEKDRPSRQIIEPVWTSKKQDVKSDIQIVLGANYAFHKDWFMKIKGLKGLKSWGSSEPFLSIKSWLSGGSCKIRTDIETAHLFRDSAPYSTNICDLAYNKIYILKTIFPPELESKLTTYIPKDINFKKAMEMIERDKGEIEKERQYYQSIFTRSIYDFCSEFNVEIPK